MRAQEAADVVNEVLKSLRANPGQFSIKITVSTAGAIGVGGAGGPGIVGIAQGGGVGFSASAAAPKQVRDELPSGVLGKIAAILATGYGPNRPICPVRLTTSLIVCRVVASRGQAVGLLAGQLDEVQAFLDREQPVLADHRDVT